MQKRTKKEIKEAIEALKKTPSSAPGFNPNAGGGKPTSKGKTSQRIRKQGV